MPKRNTRSCTYPELITSAKRQRVKIIISTMNMRLRPKVSDSPPRAEAPTRMPNRVAAPTIPFCTSLRENSATIRGRATPVMNTTMPSKNFPAEASHQMRHCMRVKGVKGASVPSRQTGLSSM